MNQKSDIDKESDIYIKKLSAILFFLQEEYSTCLKNNKEKKKMFDQSIKAKVSYKKNTDLNRVLKFTRSKAN